MFDSMGLTDFLVGQVQKPQVEIAKSAHAIFFSTLTVKTIMIMKHNYIKLMLPVLLCIVSLSASAHNFEVDGIYYNITSSTDLTVAVTYRGSYELDYSNEYSGQVSIPETVAYNEKTYRVTSIGGYAFRECSGLTSVTIPNSVTIV
jgi:hypothetical protein